jgi:site-specific recombinase XerD
VLNGTTTWTVVDSAGLPISAVDDYLHWLRATNKSSNTVLSYARHLSLLFRWLDALDLAWERVTFEQLCDFLLTAKAATPPLQQVGRRNGRGPSTLKAIAAAVREFYEYQQLEGRGPADLRLSMQVAHSSRTSHHFLAHVEARHDVTVNRLTPRFAAAPDVLRFINFETDFSRLLSNALTARDALLLSVLYDCGLRIGGALGLRHGDLDPMRQRIRVERRENLNGSLSKRRETFEVNAPTRTFDLYAHYLLDELEPAGVDSDYLFVNLRPGTHFGRPCSASNVRQVVGGIGTRAGISGLQPHMLRHTHGTALAKAGWTNAEIAARLGHRHASSADTYIHLAADHLNAKIAATQHLIWTPIPVGIS